MRGVVDCNVWKTEKLHECRNVGKVKRLKLWWQLYVTWLPVRDFKNLRAMGFCSFECTLYDGPIQYWTRSPYVHSMMVLYSTEHDHHKYIVWWSYTVLYTITICTLYDGLYSTEHDHHMYTQSNKNPSQWYFVRPAKAVTYGTVVIKIWVVLLSPYLCISGVSLSSIHYNQQHRAYINWKQQYNCLIWN